MNSTQDIFNKAKNEIKKLWIDHKELSNFVTFPNNLVLKNLKPQKAPVTDWEQGYNEKEVDKDFLNKYGFFELIGPSGHFETSEMALYVNFLDKNTYYPWHNHEAEELYFIVSGEAKFESKDQDEEILSSTKTRFHKSFQPHAITTIENKVLSFVIWKNKFEHISKLIKE